MAWDLEAAHISVFHLKVNILRRNIYVLNRRLTINRFQAITPFRSVPGLFVYVSSLIHLRPIYVIIRTVYVLMCKMDQKDTGAAEYWGSLNWY
jgi:hypothetical protein